ncbi:glycosyltransferase [Pontibacter diazotrophicus]|uniref:Glycosyltransferase n=2 Tax=Pontibacter diazotrophicus TaxID=1400979 RepID=A0A3D8LBR5_9BACT|nr:glycosyltransferase [Pontibacter diazotrophicus]
MPVYNAGQFIAESISSVLSQTCNNWELLVVDDGSTDHTASIVSDFVKVDSRIRYIYQENGKQGKARNNGIRNSKGAFLAFLDADDLWHPSKLEKQLECLEEYNVDLVFSDGWIFTEQERCKTSFGTITGLLEGADGLSLFLEKNRIPILTVLLKRESIVSVGGFTEVRNIQNAEDYHLWLKLILEGYKFYGMKEKLAYYRIHPTQNTLNDKRSTLQAIYAIQSLKIDSIIFRDLKNYHIRNWYRRLLFKYPVYVTDNFSVVLKMYREGTNRYLIYYFLKLMHSLFGTRVTRKVLTKII